MINGLIYDYYKETSRINIVTISGFLIVASLGQEMPRFSKTVESTKQQQQQEVDDELVKASNQSHNGFTEIKFWKSLLFMVYVYYCITCGLEGFFQVT
jgi:hypothetical protein